jgi:signal transduction histidine kinase
MLPELPAIAGVGLPVGLSLAVAVAGERVLESRRRAALNRALHELRRPLQALSLATSAPRRAGAANAALVTRETVDAALAALAELDRAVNGMRPALRPRPVAVDALIRSVAERWREAAAAGGRSLSVRSEVGAAAVLADRARVERAIDNLLVNALEHGTGRVRLKASLAPGAARISVADDGPGSHRSQARPRPAGRSDPRRGHGLRIVAEVAREHGGRFLLERSTRRTEAVLELPVAAREPAARGIPAA